MSDELQLAWIRVSDNVTDEDVQEIADVLEQTCIDDGVVVARDIAALSESEVENYVERLIEALENA